MIGKFLALLISLTVLFCLNASAQTADELIGKYIEARGGLQKLKAVQSIKTTGKLVEKGSSIPYTIHQKRPSLFRFDADFQGKILTMAYNGEIGWKVDPFHTTSELKRMEGAELQDAQEQADLDGALIDYKEKGHSVLLFGKEDLDNIAVYKLQLSLKNGDVQTIYINCQTYLEVKTIAVKVTPVGETEIETCKKDYRTVNGVTLPYTTETRMGDKVLYTLFVDKIEIGTVFDDSLFQIPVKAQATKVSEH
jgi:outer membrane lipoprotein-sorting protein